MVSVVVWLDGGKVGFGVWFDIGLVEDEEGSLRWEEVRERLLGRVFFGSIYGICWVL